MGYVLNITFVTTYYSVRIRYSTYNVPGTNTYTYNDVQYVRTCLLTYLLTYCTYNNVGLARMSRFENISSSIERGEAVPAPRTRADYLERGVSKHSPPFIQPSSKLLLEKIESGRRKKVLWNKEY